MNFGKKKGLWTGAAIVIGIFLALVMILARYSDKIADDYLFLNNGFDVVGHLYENDSGRIAHGVVIAIGYELFGDHIVKIMPVIIILLTMIAFGVLLRVALKRGLAKCFVMGGILTLCYSVLMISFFDFDLFLSASTAHSLTVVWIILYAAFLIKSWRDEIAPRWIFGMFFVCIFCGTLSELAALLPGIASMIMILVSLKKKKKGRVGLYSLQLVAFVVAFLIIYFSPGSIGRRSANMVGLDLWGIIGGIAGDYWHLLRWLVSWRILGLVGSALIIWAQCHNSKVKMRKKTCLIVGAGLVLSPCVIFATTHYAIGYSAMRIENIAMLCFAAGITLLIISSLHEVTLNRRISIAITGTTVVAILIGFAICVFSPILKAEIMRKSALWDREVLANRTSEDRVILLPAPLLLNSSEAIDISFLLDPENLTHSDWLYPTILGYYGLKEHEIEIATQPNDYCIDEDVYNRFHTIMAKACGTY